MNEFSGIDFAVGTVRGFRRWKIGADGWLNPLIWSGEWHPGENVAECKTWPDLNAVPYVDPSNLDVVHGYTQRVEKWRTSHGFLRCQHGFYAYFDGHDAYGFSYSTPAISGVVDGYGEVLIGTKGFRSTKARIVALTVEPHDSVWHLEQRVIDRIAGNYPDVPIFTSEEAMRAEYPCPVPYTEEQVIAAAAEASIAAIDAEVTP